MKTRLYARSSRTLTAAAGVMLMIASACQAPADKPATKPAAKTSASAQPGDAPQVGVVEGSAEHYDFTFESPKDAKVGVPVVASFGVTAVDPWHLNLEYPASLVTDVNAAIELPKERQGKEDALHFGEDGAAFELKFTPTVAGKSEVSGTLKFAVCQADACLPSSEKFSFVVDVAAAG